MLYSFGRQVFPADTHVGRVLSRLEPYRELGLSLEGLELLKKRFRRWDDLLAAPRRVVEKLVYSGGLSTKKTLALRAALRKLQ